jgi:hypothetical protein
LIDTFTGSENLTCIHRSRHRPVQVASTEENFMAALLKNKALLALISAFVVLMVIGIMTS